MDATTDTYQNKLSDLQSANTTNVTFVRQYSYTGSTVTFYISVCLIWVPGTLTNLLALIFIVRDVRKAIFPAMFLLCCLCCWDLAAVLFSWTYHIMLRYFKLSYTLCSSLAFIHTFFNIFASVTNSIMAIDRVLAIRHPFFYKRYINVSTWVRTSILAGLLIAVFSTFPMVGLGDVLSSTARRYCESTSYRRDPIKRVFGVMFGIIGAVCVIVISVSNLFLIRTLVGLNKRVAMMERSSAVTSDESTTTSRAAPFEVAFAKLMLALASAHLICSSPFQILVLVRQFNVAVSSATQGYIHLLAGFVYTVDPMVYILVRKANKKCFQEAFCLCFLQDNHI